MNFNRCPICHCNIDLFALAKDEATSNLLAKLAKMDTLTGNAIIDYLTLFSPEKTALTANKALRLVTDVEALAGDDWARMALAMATTVDIIRAKSERGEKVEMFTSHGYLKKVLASIPANDTVAPDAYIGGMPTSLIQPSQPRSATGNALAQLEAMKHE